MIMLPYKSLCTALMLAAMIPALGTTALSQSAGGSVEARVDAAVKKIQDACGNDVKTYCGNVTPGDGRLALCMMAHEDKISNKCDYALFSAARNLDRALDRIEQTADACWDDIEKHCSNIADGGGRIAQCLVSKKASLQSSCQSMLNKFPSK
jgi:hypothetical protein